MAFAKSSKTFTQHADASGIGLGAVLYQELHAKEWVISFASQTLTKGEIQYPMHKQEFLALKWLITTAFHYYLYGKTFTIKSNNNPLA